MTDSKGDIVPDLVYITLNDTFAVDQSLTSVELSYRGNNYSIPAAQCQITGTTIAVPFTTQSGPDAIPAGTVTIVMDVEGEVQRHTRNFTDGVGPILVAADVRERDAAEAEVLYLTFSEKVFPSTIAGGQLQLIPNGTTDTTVLQISRIESVVNDSTLSVVLVQSDLTVNSGDLLRLVPGVSGGTVSDVNGNLPHALNPAVVIGFRKGAAAIKEACYKDTDADGVIDLLVIRFRRPVAVEELDTLKMYWRGQNHTIPPGRLEHNDDSSVTLQLYGTVTGKNDIATGGSMFIAQTFRVEPASSRTAEVIDSAAPVLKEAILKVGTYSESGMKNPDTLLVRFSENVQVNGAQPFILESPGSISSYKFTVDPPVIHGETAAFLIRTIDPESAAPSRGDSIRINEQKMVADTGKVYQGDPRNRQVPLKIDYPPVVWRIIIGPNPFEIGNEFQTVKVTSRMSADIADFKASLTIYDGVGNAIVDIPVMEIADKSFMYRWNGVNRHGRFVSPGTYIVIVRVYDGTALSWSDRARMGVVRRGR